MAEAFRTGLVALLGKPNAGKSTLLNALIGTKLSAVSPLPQTTRERLAGVYTDDNRQIVFIDLPGLITPTDRLNEVLLSNVLEGVQDVDAVLHLVDVADEEQLGPEMEAALQRVKAPLLLVINKIDGKRAKTDAGSWAGEKLPPAVRSRYRRVLGISAIEKKGLTPLLDALTEHLPEGPPLYDPESLTDRDLRYLTQEMIREKLFLHLHEELPYATAVLVEEFKEREGEKWFISAMIYVERESQKGMVIGKGGEMLKKISQSARVDIERLCDAQVYLELRVKVREKWRKKDHELEFFGYKARGKKKRK